MIKVTAIIAISFITILLFIMALILCKAASIADKIEEEMHRKYFEEEHKYKEEDF